MPAAAAVAVVADDRTTEREGFIVHRINVLCDSRKNSVSVETLIRLDRKPLLEAPMFYLLILADEILNSSAGSDSFQNYGNRA